MGGGQEVGLKTVGKPVHEGGERVMRPEVLSYVARLTDAETFGRLALVETYRRGTETARAVCAVRDGVEWMQGRIARSPTTRGGAFRSAGPDRNILE